MSDSRETKAEPTPEIDYRAQAKELIRLQADQQTDMIRLVELAGTGGIETLDELKTRIKDYIHISQRLRGPTKLMTINRMYARLHKKLDTTVKQICLDLAEAGEIFLTSLPGDRGIILIDMDFYIDFIAFHTENKTPLLEREKAWENILRSSV